MTATTEAPPPGATPGTVADVASRFDEVTDADVRAAANMRAAAGEVLGSGYVSELARRIGVSREPLSLRLEAKRRVEIGTMRDVADALGVPLARILDGIAEDES